MKEPKIIISGHHNCPRCEVKDVDLYMITGPYIVRDVCGDCVKVITGLEVYDKLDASKSTRYKRNLDIFRKLVSLLLKGRKI